MTSADPFGREVKFARADLTSVEADGSFSGYASLFGLIDLNRDLVEPGAFAASLRARGAAGIKMLYQHDPAEPIGVWTEVAEDGTGLFVRGQLMTSVARGAEVLELMRAGALDGLSIGFRTVKGRSEARTGIRRLIEIDLWEISVVTFPMLPGARVASVKTATGTHPTRRELERWLTQDAGLTRKAARALLSGGYRALTGTPDAADTAEDRLRSALLRATRHLKSAR
ncbi:hypothetical protein GGD81_002823 [Rhodobium orientis]|uniref:Peptidase U35 n=1 Tax=Rhodobium orientis TaxID=34017 RepID=A0A327JIE1_9HYPH|nr:HK97 family phage prohead protease [Rhodobium orientis]MBB4303771.1 hypothetical protein [Rhodobium orientis]MBK5947891.1 peptidase U35 [Rhodobium orientis]RAI26059.1 peptidase U35 [Rhodobium orientis]